MGIKQNALEILAHTFKTTFGVLGERKRARILSYLTERLTPTLSVKTKYGSIFFCCPGEVPFFRAETLLTKEPETIEWIDSFQEDSVFWDIGANIGVYSLYAALKPDVRVLAFEPSAFNYHILNRNIEINKMDDKIFSLCLAFTDKTCLDHLYMTNTNVGGALSSFAEAIDWKGKHVTAKFRQWMIGFSIDDFIGRFSPLFPNHIKIDVDGIEGKIIKGAKKTISDKRLKSLLIELDTSRKGYYQDIIQLLENVGMKLIARKHTSNFDKGEFVPVYNHIFVRQ
jgi:FkbM family methyltransferase